MRRKVLFAIVAALMLSFGMIAVDLASVPTAAAPSGGITPSPWSGHPVVKAIGPTQEFSFLGYEGDKAVLQLTLAKAGVTLRAEITKDGGMFLTIKDRAKSHFYAVTLPEGTVQASSSVSPYAELRLISIKKDGSLVYGVYANGELVGIMVIRNGKVVAFYPL